MIDTIIFDIGNVLVDFDWGEYINNIFTNKETVSAVRDALFGSSFWSELDRGVLSRDELLEGFRKRANGYAEEIRIAFDRVGDALTCFDYTIPWIKELKARGFRVLYLSNYSHHVTQCNPKVLEFTDHMDGGIFSCNVKLIKPDRRIYEKLITQYSLIPENCIFIDDNADNIKAANKLGINAIRFTDYNSVHAELDKLPSPEAES